MYLLNPINLSYLVLKHKIVLEFTISPGKLFHLLIVLTQKEFILNVFRALGFFSFFELPCVWVSENSNSPFMEMASIFCTILKTCIISIRFFYTSKLIEIAFLVVLRIKDLITEYPSLYIFNGSNILF